MFLLKASKFDSESKSYELGISGRILSGLNFDHMKSLSFFRAMLGIGVRFPIDSKGTFRKKIINILEIYLLLTPSFYPQKI